MLYAILAVLILIADQASKYWTTLNIELNTGVKAFIPGFIQLRNVHNTGAAFSLFEGMRWILVVVTIAVAVLIVVLLVTRRIRGGFGRVTAVLVLAGALGNLIDRVIHGYVVDMLEFDFLIFGKSFPVFNIADIFITVGGILFCVYILLHKDQPEEPQTVRGRGGSVTTRPAPRRSAPAAQQPQRAVSRAAAPTREQAPAARTAESGTAPRRTTMQTAQRPAAQPAQRPVAQPVQRPVAQPAQRPAAQPAQRPAAQPVQRPAAQPAQRPAAQPAQRPAAQPVQRPAAQPVQRTAPAPKPEPKPAVSVESYDLDDILAEFRDL